jgi:hypothetical protein
MQNQVTNTAVQGANMILDPLQNLWATTVSYVPEIITAIIIVILGLIIAPIFGSIARRIARLIKLDALAEKSGVKTMLEDADMHFTFSGVIGYLVKWFILLGFFIAAANVFHWAQLSNVLYKILFYIPEVIVAVLFVAFGTIAGSFVEGAVTKTLKVSTAPVKHANLIGKAAKWAIIVFAVLAALLQLGIAQSLVMILYGGIVLALALAFGLGGREKAAKILDYMDNTQK